MIYCATLQASDPVTDRAMELCLSPEINLAVGLSVGFLIRILGNYA